MAVILIAKQFRTQNPTFLIQDSSLTRYPLDPLSKRSRRHHVYLKFRSRQVKNIAVNPTSVRVRDTLPENVPPCDTSDAGAFLFVVDLKGSRDFSCKRSHSL